MIDIAIIGCGRWGQNLIRVFSELPGAQVIACCNKSNHDQLSQLRARYPHLETTQSLRDLLTNPRVDAIVVATPDQTHFEIARQALQAGKHVFVEKPLALSLAHAEELMELAGVQGKMLMTGHILQYHPAIRWMKERIEGGVVGPVSIRSTRIDVGVARPDASLLWSSAIHDVAVIQYLLGEEPEQLTAVGTSLNGSGLCDILFVNLSFRGGGNGHITASFSGPLCARELVLQTTQEAIVFDGAAESLRLFPRQAVSADREPGRCGRQASVEQGIQPNIPDLQEPLKIECQHFLECIRSNRVPLSGGDRALAVMRTLDRIERSLNSANVTSGK
jgi:UDP-2-acetamido-3-amino-2,3-dideoxy-glucuronate N-acetyltransferase